MAISMRHTVLAVSGILVLGIAGIGLARSVPTTAADTATAASDASIVTDVDAILAADQMNRGPLAPRDVGAAKVMRRLGAARRVVHATVLVDLPKGGLTTIQVDHGRISAVNATSLTIAETGGGSPAVTLGDETRVRRNGQKASITDLKTGDEVFVLSKVESGGTVAYLVVVPRS
jgi:hypothetical protein